MSTKSTIDAMLELIPNGWFLNALIDERTPIRYVDETHTHIQWKCELQWVEGGRLCVGWGSTPHEAIHTAIIECKQRFSVHSKPKGKSIYGFCPICGGMGMARERRLNGNDICVNGHKYPSKDAVV